MSVHYKFKSALEYDTVTFDGLHISVKDLKKAILQQKKIGKTIDFDLQITNAQTKETYTNDEALISKNASLIVARVPLTQQQRKQWENNKQTPALRTNDNCEQSSLSQVDISSLDLSEEDKIKTMMSQATSDYDPSNYVKVRGSNQVGTVPASYVCFKCHQRGHWIKDCPFDGSSMATETIKKSTGIPRSFMIEVEGPQVPGARMTPSGVYAVPAIDHEVYKEKKIEKPPFLPDKPPKATTIPEDLICGICKDLLQDAVMVPCCGISFCDECIRNYLVDSEESECPDCNEKEVSPDTLIPNRFLRNNVNTFKNETGYIKVKPQIIQRVPTPPRPSLPDFVPPPEYVESTTPAENQSSTKTDKSPIFEDSPVTRSDSSPFQSRTTSNFNENYPCGNELDSRSNKTENCAQSANVDSEKSPEANVCPQKIDESTQNPDKDDSFPSKRPISTFGQFQNFRHPRPKKPLHFPEPVIVSFPPMRRTQGYGHSLFGQKGLAGKGYQADKTNQPTVVKENKTQSSGEQASEVSSVPADAAESDSKEKGPVEEDSSQEKPADEKEKKGKKSDMEVDDISSVSSNTSEEPPPPVENRRADEGQSDPSQCPSYAIPSLFSGLHPVTLPPPGSERYPPPRPAETFLSSQSDSGEERSSTPTVDERMEIPPLRTAYDPYRQPNYGMPYYDQHYSVPPSFSMPYDPNTVYDRAYRGFTRAPRGYRGRFTMRQPPPPGSRPITPTRNEEEAYLAFQRMLKEKEERDKRKTEKLKSSRRSTSRSRSRSGGRSRRSFSGACSRSRTRSRTPARRTRSRSKKRSHTRSRSFVISRSRSRSYTRSPLNERNYSPKKYSPHRSPPRYDRFDSGYGHSNQDYRRGGYRSRGRKRFYNKSPPRGHDHSSYSRVMNIRETLKNRKKVQAYMQTTRNRRPELWTTFSRSSSPKMVPKKNKRLYERYRDENYLTSPHRSHRSPSRYYDQRVSPKCNDYSRSSRDRENRSGERESDTAFRDRSTRRRSHSNSLVRNHFDSEKDRDRDRDKDKDRENERGRDRDRDLDRENYRRRSRSRRSTSRRYTPVKKTSEERGDRSTEKSPDHRPKDDRDKDGRNRSRERRSYDYGKDKRKYSRERNRSKDNDRDNRRRGRSRDRSRSRDKRKRSISTSRDKRKRSSSSNRKRRSPSRQRSISRVKIERRRSHSLGSQNLTRTRSQSLEKDRKRVGTGQQQEEASKKSITPEKSVEPPKTLSPKVSEKEDDDKKDKRKEKEKKKKKKEEDRAARKKKKKEKRKKQEAKSGSEPKTKVLEGAKEKISEKESAPTPNDQHSDSVPNFVSTFTAVEDSENASLGVPQNNTETEPMDIGPVDDNAESDVHMSYDCTMEDVNEKDKKGILAALPEISKWELDDSHTNDSNNKPNTVEIRKKEPEFPVKVTREVIKRAENAIFKRAVNAIREPSKATSEERKEKRYTQTPEKDKAASKECRTEQDADKMKKVYLSRDKEKVHKNPVELVKSKTEVKRTINSLQITIPIASENDSNEEGKGKISKYVVGLKEEGQKSPPVGRVSVKERLGSKVEKSGRSSSPPLIHSLDKRSRNTDEESEPRNVRKDHQMRSTLSSMVESIDSKRSAIDEAHFVPNYDESSDEEENVKPRHETDRESKSFSGNGKDSKKRHRSSSESFSEESTKKHKKKKSKSKKKKQKRSKKHVSDSSDSSDSEREKKKHKKSKKKKKSKH